MKTHWLIISFICAHLAAWAQTGGSVKQFSADAEFRTRAEYLDGFGKLVPKTIEKAPNLFIAERARLNFRYSSDLHDVYFSVQDVHIWGDNKHWESKIPIMVNEAWIRYKFHPNWSVKTGRQQITYTNGRILWKKEWNNYAATHDALLFNYQQNNWNVEFGGGYNSQAGLSQQAYLKVGDYPLYKAMGIVSATKTWTSGSLLHLLNFTEGIEAPGRTAMYVRNSAGFHLIYKQSVFQMDAQFYHQHGVHTNGDRIMAAAWLWHAGIKLNQLTITAGYHAHTGESYNDDQSDKLQKTFTTPYFSGKVMYGYMEYLANGGLQKTNGLHDVFSDWSINLKSKLRLQAITHIMSYTRLPGENLSKQIGAETDFVISKGFKGMQLSAGYSFLLAHPDFAMERTSTKEVYFPQWAWLMMSYKPELFRLK